MVSSTVSNNNNMISSRRPRSISNNNQMANPLAAVPMMILPRNNFLKSYTTVTPPHLPLTSRTNVVAIISSFATRCPEAMCCVVAPLVVGCVLVFNGFHNYLETKESKLREAHQHNINS